MRIILRLVLAVVMSSVLVAGTGTYVEEGVKKMSNPIHPTIWLAISVWMEARGEPYEGKLGVAWAHVNRANDPRWPNTVTRVIWQSYQFSWTNPNDPNRIKLDDVDWNDPTFVESHKAAVAAYYALVHDPTKGANHYLTTALAESRAPKWYDEQKVTTVIGGHAFLKL